MAEFVLFFFNSYFYEENDSCYLFISFKQFTNPEMPGYVGFANLPNQVHRKSVKKGFEFTLMVVGKYALRSILFPRFTDYSCTF